MIAKVKRRSPNGEFYQSPTPDGYSGIVLAGEVTRFWFEETPLSIYGASHSSQGMAYLSAGEKERKQSESFFKKAAGNVMAAELASQPYSPLISLMTADYLLTAANLPGWPGAFEEINYWMLIKRSLGELSNGLYANDRIGRELEILTKIAKQHRLYDQMRQELASKWKYVERADYDDDGSNYHSVFIVCKDTFIKNILDAAYFVQSALLIRQKVRLPRIINGFMASCRYKLSARKRVCRMIEFMRGTE